MTILHLFVSRYDPGKRRPRFLDLPSYAVDGPWLGEYVSRTFNHSIDKQEIYWQWFLDQRFFGLKFHQWKATRRPT